MEVFESLKFLRNLKSLKSLKHSQSSQIFCDILRFLKDLNLGDVNNGNSRVPTKSSNGIQRAVVFLEESSEKSSEKSSEECLNDGPDDFIGQ